MTRLLAICLSAWALAISGAAADNRYGTWEGGGGDTQELVNRLRALTDEAANARAADRRFLEDLRDLIDAYDKPWTATLISDDFRDGDYTRDPAWTLASGDYQVDRRRGLVSEVTAGTSAGDNGRGDGQGERGDPGAELAMALLDSLLEGARQGQREEAPAARGAAPDASATLYRDERIPDAFSLTLHLEALSRDGEYVVEIYRDRPGDDGYALIFRPDDPRPFELVRTSRGRTATVEAATTDVPPGTFRLRLTRKAGGAMALEAGGETLFEVRDRTWSEGFAGIALTNRDGRFAVTQVTLLGGRS